MRKQGKLLNLSNIKVDIEDFDPNSTYFVISNFNGTFLSGKNAFYINGSRFLKNNSEILIEVLDAKEQPLLVEADKKAKVNSPGFTYSVNVYETTSNGIGKIILLGTDTNGRKVRWTSNVEINNNKVNSSEVTFKKTPSLEVIPFINVTSETEIVELEKTGSCRGISLVPKEGTLIQDIKVSKNINYLIESEIPVFSSDMNGEAIVLDSEKRIVREVLSSTQALINYPIVDQQGRTKNLTSANFKIKYFPFNNPTGVSVNNFKPIGTAEVNFRDIETYTGKIYRYKIYRSSINAQYDSECISTGYFFGYELIYDSETPFRHLSEVGKIINQESLKNWRVVSGTGSPSISHTPNKLIDSMTTSGFKSVSGDKNGIIMKIYNSGSSDSTNGYFSLDLNSYVDRTSESFRSNSIRLYKNIEYVFSCKLSAEKNSGIDSHIRFYIISSDSNIIKNKETDGTGLKIHEIKLSHNETNKNLFSITKNFFVDEDVKGTLFIELNSVDITISNISLKPYTDFSYGPDVFTIRIPVDARAKNEGVKFTAELFDINNNYVKTDYALSDIKYLDPDGITYPFNVFAIKTEIDVVDNKISSLESDFNSFTSSMVEVSS